MEAREEEGIGGRKTEDNRRNCKFAKLRISSERTRARARARQWEKNGRGEARLGSGDDCFDLTNPD